MKEEGGDKHEEEEGGTKKHEEDGEEKHEEEEETKKHEEEEGEREGEHIGYFTATATVRGPQLHTNHLPKHQKPFDINPQHSSRYIYLTVIATKPKVSL